MLSVDYVCTWEMSDYRIVKCGAWGAKRELDKLFKRKQENIHGEWKHKKNAKNIRNGR